MLCSECQSVVREAEASEEKSKRERNGRLNQSHHSSSQAFLFAIQQKCYICNKLMADARSSLKDGIDEYDICVSSNWSHSEGGISVRLRAAFDKDGNSSRFSTSFLIDAFNGDDDTANCTLMQPAPSTDDTGHSDTLSIVKSWMDLCMRDHMVCSTPIMDISVSYCPDRLIDTAPPELGHGRWRLVDVKSHCAGVPYFTLSHRWGSTRPFKLQRSTYAAMKRGLDYSVLPSTYQDAITVTKALGVRYLWIDSICIYQDDNLDIQLAASQMAEVYSHATCNIVAAAEGSTGLFRSRDPALCGSRAVILHKSQYGFKHCYKIREANVFHYLDGSSLLRRGWVLQEMILASRSIIFGGDQVYWECSTHKTFENNPAHDSTLDSDQSFLSWGGYLNLRKELRTVGAPSRGLYGGVHGTSFYQLWALLVSDYSRLELTNPADKLLAISGIAQAFERRTKQSYIAGLWSDKIEMQLLWICRGSHRPLVQYRAPSWSWASVNADVFRMFVSNARIIAQVMSWTIEPALVGHPRAKFGLLKAASITVRGRCFDTIRFEDRYLIKGLPTTALNFESSSGGCFSTTYLDVDTEAKVGHGETRDVKALAIALIKEDATSNTNSSMNKKSVRMQGLLIKESTSCRGACERIGAFELRDYFSGDSLQLSWVPNTWLDLFQGWSNGSGSMFDVESAHDMTIVTII